MRDILATTKCYTESCGGTMEGTRGNYQYTECGLDSVYLNNVLVFHCPRCNALEVPDIPAVGALHSVIAIKLLCKKTLLSGKEMRFLRKFMGYSVNEFVEIMGAANKSVVSRWETRTHGKEVDRIVRLLVMVKLVTDISGHPKTSLRNVTVESLRTKIEDAMKTMEGKMREERYDINPEELAAMDCPQAAPERQQPAGVLQ